MVIDDENKRRTIFMFKVLMVILAFAIVACGSEKPRSETKNYTTLKPISSINIKNLSGTPLTNHPITFGHAFVEGDIASSQFISANIIGGNALDIQLDKKRTHGDGSLRHGIISIIIPALAVDEVITIELSPSDVDPSAHRSTIISDDLLSMAFNPNIEITEGLTTYSASLKELIASPNTITWLEGGVTSEWIITGPLKDTLNNEHTHLMAAFHIRYYSPSQIRIDLILENTHAFYSEVGDFPGTPRNITYDWAFKNGINTIDSGTNLEHFSRARWRKTYTSYGSTLGTLSPDPGDTVIQFNPDYFVKSKAVASYDTSFPPQESLLSKIETEHSNANNAPMQLGMIDASFSAGVEGSIDAAWSVAYFLSGDYRARDAMIDNANAAGSIGIHYRHEQLTNTQQAAIVSVIDFDEASSRSDSANIPYFDGDQATPDTAHQNSFAYLPYLLTGDYYLLEELHFWANWNLLSKNTQKRNDGGAKGLIYSNQIRAQAWALRTILNSAYITPDAHPQKTYFENILNQNINWYTNTYVDESAPWHNQFGVLTVGQNENSGLSSENFRAAKPWMDNWVTAVAGRAYNMGYTQILPFLQWKARFPIALMTNPDMCWIFSTAYVFYFREGKNQPLYSTWKEVYEKTIEYEYNADGGLAILNTECGSNEMAQLINDGGYFINPYITGQILYSSNTTSSYFGRMQGAIAAAVDAGAPGSTQAWETWKASSVHPEWGAFHKKKSTENGNKYNIIPSFQ